MQKILFLVIGITAQLLFAWFSHKSGKLSDSGSVFGYHYDSKLISSTLITLKYFWLLLIGNMLFSYGAKTGIESFGSYMAFMLIWIALAPISTLIFNSFVNKESINYLHIIGIILIFCGSVIISANKEIFKLFH